jgi:hypothetical protein
VNSEEQLHCTSSRFRMKSFLRATDIYSTVWPLHLISRIFGLAPYSLKPKSECLTNRNIFTCMCRTWSIIWIILLVAFEFITISKIITANYTLKQKTVEIFFFATECSCSVITLFLSFTINHDKVPQILEKLSEIDQLFSTKRYRNQVYKNSRLLIVVQFTVLTSTALTLFYLSICIDLRDISFRIIGDISLQIFTKFLNSIRILYFLNLVLVLRNKYKYLNSELSTHTTQRYKFELS